MNALVAYADSDSESEHEGAGTKEVQSVRKLIPVLPPIKGGTKQRVRIGLPKLNEQDESDEDVPSEKRLKLQGSGVGLTAILPQPRGVMKEPKKPVKLTTQNMLPYSLTKKKQEAKKPGPVKQANRQQRGSDEESDEEPATFFSHLEGSTAGEPACTEEMLGHGTDTVPLAEIAPAAAKLVLPAPVVGLPSAMVTAADATKDTMTRCEQGSASVLQTYDSHSSSGAHWGHPEVLPDERQHEQPMDEEAFRRLAGGRNLKLKSESLDHIVELDESQVQGRIKDYQKYMTEEQPTIPKGPAPSTMQKKKHQLHYLIHQAQSREVELRNHWAQAAQNKRQSGMKYGFF